MTHYYLENVSLSWTDFIFIFRQCNYEIETSRQWPFFEINNKI